MKLRRRNPMRPQLAQQFVALLLLLLLTLCQSASADSTAAAERQDTDSVQLEECRQQLAAMNSSYHFDEKNNNKRTRCAQLANNLGYRFLAEASGPEDLLAAGRFLDAAIEFDPYSIITRRNMAWLWHQTTVDQDIMNAQYSCVLRLLWLRLAEDLHASRRDISYDALRKNVLWIMQITTFQETTTAGAASHLRNFTLQPVQPTPRHACPTDTMSFDIDFIHDGRGSVKLRLLQMRQHSRYPLQPRHGPDREEHFLSIFEREPNLATCHCPFDNRERLHSELLKLQLIGFFHGIQRVHGVKNVHRERIAYLKGPKHRQIAASFARLENRQETLFVDNSTALTQASVAMLNHYRAILQRVQQKNVHGSILEAGAWRGGMQIWAALLLHGTGRKIVVADSFTGVPPTRRESQHKDPWSGMPHHLYSVPSQHVKDLFTLYGVNSDSVTFIEGHFNESLQGCPAGEIAVLRIDADTYDSVLDVLHACHACLSPGAVVIIDDFHLTGARRAVLEFRMQRGIHSTIFPISEDYVFACRQGRKFSVPLHLFPLKPIQGAYFTI